jgi:hypothetical protein
MIIYIAERAMTIYTIKITYLLESDLGGKATTKML